MRIMAGKYANLILLLTVVTLTHSWDLPNLPSGKRSQYFLLHDNGGYKYGYDTGLNHFAKQAGDVHNEVAGHYVYKDPSGADIDIKYTAGVNGFIPEGLEKLSHQTKGAYAPSQGYTYSAPTSYSENSADEQRNTYSASTSYSEDSADEQRNSGDASYSFTIDTDSYKRQESSDASGNVQGKYSYTNEAGQHDLSYIAGSNTGFIATSGSLSQPNGLEGKSFSTSSTGFPASRTSSSIYAPAFNPHNDGSYSFEYSTNDQSRQESADAGGNVQGRYTFTNEAGTHDLDYVAGSKTGFQPTGGSLAHPNGLIGKSKPVINSAFTSRYLPPTSYSIGETVPAAYSPVVPNTDGSYSFEYSTNDQSRQESSDASGHVQGRYSFTNEAGTHDLNYVAGAKTGFQPTGGSLSVPNGLIGRSEPVTHFAPAVSSRYIPPVATYSSDGIIPAAYSPTVPNADGSYSFEYSTNDQSRQESSDASGNIQGRYSFINEAGSHDLSYVAGSQTGFQPTGGSLAVPNGLAGNSIPTTYSSHRVSNNYVPPTTTYSDNTDDDESNTGDSSYSFTIDTDEYKRQESSDAEGNVKGSYTYKNAAGSHDLSFVSGSQTGFLPTGGSLAHPNGLSGKNIQSTYSALPSESFIPSPSNSGNSEEEQVNSGDASYSFTVDTNDYKRKETADPEGNVMGTYSYKNKAGSHDLNYIAGANTGFVATSGSLSVPNGILNSRTFGPFGSSEYIPPQVKMSDFMAVSNAKPSFSQGKVGNVFLKNYYPSKSQSKYGYIFESA